MLTHLWRGEIGGQWSKRIHSAVHSPITFEYCTCEVNIINEKYNKIFKLIIYKFWNTVFN